jgi:hypothetical protein
VPNREEREKNFYNGGSSQQRAKGISSKPVEVKTRVIYESTPHPPQSQPQPSRNEYLGEEYAMGAMDLNSEDPELQMAIMQSMGGVGNTNKGSSYSFESEMNNSAFIA